MLQSQRYGPTAPSEISYDDLESYVQSTCTYKYNNSQYTVKYINGDQVYQCNFGDFADRIESNVVQHCKCVHGSVTAPASIIKPVTNAAYENITDDEKENTPSNHALPILTEEDVALTIGFEDSAAVQALLALDDNNANNDNTSLAVSVSATPIENAVDYVMDIPITSAETTVTNAVDDVINEHEPSVDLGVVSSNVSADLDVVSSNVSADLGVVSSNVSNVVNPDVNEDFVVVSSNVSNVVNPDVNLDFVVVSSNVDVDLGVEVSNEINDNADSDMSIDDCGASTSSVNTSIQRTLPASRKAMSERMKRKIEQDPDTSDTEVDDTDEEEAYQPSKVKQTNTRRKPKRVTKPKTVKPKENKVTSANQKVQFMNSISAVCSRRDDEELFFLPSEITDDLSKPLESKNKHYATDAPKPITVHQPDALFIL